MSNSNENEEAHSPQKEYGKWTLVATSGLAPFPRNGHSMVVHQKNLFTYGGYNQAEYSGQLHMFSPANSNSWIPLKDGPLRTLHTAVTYKNSMILFGGVGPQKVHSFWSGSKESQEEFNDTWEFSFERQAWTKWETQGIIPTPRDGHSAVVYEESMYVFGGSDDNTIFFDFFALDLETKLWRRPRASGTLPSPRRLHTCVVWDGSLYIFGGYDGKNSFNDIFRFDFTTTVWSVVPVDGEAPRARYGHSAIVHKGSMYIFGGYGGGGGFRKDLWQFNFETHKWTLLSSQGELPPRRRHTVAVFEGKMYIFGGALSGNSYLNDMWTYEFENDTTSAVEDTLREDLLKMLDNPNFYPDVSFKIGEKTVRAHKCLLAARCSYFDTLFKSGLKEANTNEITIDDVREDVFIALLKYLYGGPDNVITPEVSADLLILSDRYMLPHLKWACENIVLEGISIENVASLLIASETYSCTRLYKASLAFICLHHQQVVKTEEFKSLPQKLLLEVMGAVSEHKVVRLASMLPS